MIRTYASVSCGRILRFASQSSTRLGPALYAAAARPRLPNCARNWRSNSADFGNAWMGSNGSARPTLRAVAGMNCAIPCAPAWLTEKTSNRLSCQISRRKKSSGSAFSVADRSSVAQIASADTPLEDEAASFASPDPENHAVTAALMASTVFRALSVA